MLLCSSPSSFNPESRGESFAGYTLLYGIRVYIVRSHRGEVSHKDYSFTEYEFAVCNRGGENSPGVFLRNMYTLCVVTRVSSLTRTVPYGRYIHRV